MIRCTNINELRTQRSNKNTNETKRKEKEKKKGEKRKRKKKDEEKKIIICIIKKTDENKTGKIRIKHIN